MVRNPFLQIAAYRVEKNVTIAGGGDQAYNLSEILSGTGINVIDVIAVIPEGCRPAVSWAEVHPVMFFNSSGVGTWCVCRLIPLLSAKARLHLYHESDIFYSYIVIFITHHFFNFFDADVFIGDNVF